MVRLGRIISAAWWIALLAGIPIGLVHIGGWPTRRLVPSASDLTAWIRQPLTPGLFATATLATGWLIWIMFVAAAVVRLWTLATNVSLRLPAVRLPGPLQGLTAAVLGATAISSAATTHPSPAVDTASAELDTQSRTHEPHYLVLAGQAYQAAAARTAPPCADPVRVHRGDTLSGIARRCLGDADRWPEIFARNHGTTYPQVGGRLTNPDLIYPGWTLHLPDPPSRPPQRRPDDPHSPPPAPQRPTVEPTPANATPAPAASRPPAETAGPAVGTEATPSPHPSGQAADHHDHSAGVTLPGGWISLPFAAALLAAASMVWLHRRRYIPKPVTPTVEDDPSLHPLPTVITRIRRTVRQQAPDLLDPPATPQPSVADFNATPTADRPHLPPVGPSGLDLAGVGPQISPHGLALTGPGAIPASRALLIATLSSGSPTDPDAKGQVIIPADTLATLLDTDTVHADGIPRLQVTPTLPDALTLVEEFLIERRRLLHEHDAEDLAGMRATHPYHPPMPPILLLSHTPSSDQHARLVTTMDLGAPLQITTVLLGDWPPGDTLTVHTAGHTTDGNRLAVLDLPTTRQLLQVLREAHTGEPSTATPAATSANLAPAAAAAAPSEHETPAKQPEPTPPNTAAPDTTHQPETINPTDPTAAPGTPHRHAAADTGIAQPDTGTAATAHPRHRPPVRIQLLGQPAIFDRDGNPIPGLRHHARELLVYLAVHRGGADLSDLMEAFWPTATVRRAAQRLSTEAGDLRRRIRQAADDKPIQPVINTGGRYHLDPTLIDLDVWRLLDTLRQANRTTDPATRTALLRQAVAAHTGTLAQGHDYDWIDQPREHLRRHGIHARLNLAELITDHDPHQAAELLQAAAALDATNEDLARRAIRALAHVGDITAIRAVMQRLRTALDHIDEQPSDETIALAESARSTSPPPRSTAQTR